VRSLYRTALLQTCGGVGIGAVEEGEISGDCSQSCRSGPGRDVRICISKNFLSDAAPAAAIRGPHLGQEHPYF